MGRVSQRARNLVYPLHHLRSYWSKLDGDGTIVWGRGYLLIVAARRVTELRL